MSQEGSPPGTPGERFNWLANAVMAVGLEIPKREGAFAPLPVPAAPRRRVRLRTIVKAMRPVQWSKNMLIFGPLILAHQAHDLAKLLATLLAFVTFSLCASAIYIANDLFDVEDDRHHPKKRKRPFAAATLPLTWAPFLCGGLLALSFGLSLAVLPWGFIGLLLLYFATNVLYTLWLKQHVMVDVMVLAGLYTLRIVAGGVVAAVPVSEWLMAFSLFLFTSLAFVKRYAELSRLAGENQQSARGRGYQVSDLNLIESIGPTNGYLAVLVLALYINSQPMHDRYSQPWAFWLICPLLSYWITRLWFLAKRQQLHEDPLVFALRDRISLGVGAVMGLLFLVACLRW
jgi:4-hydroxybenzoate polyprenyltransferase